jgi:hypothetical protein
LAGIVDVAGSELAVPVGIVDAGGGTVPASCVTLGATVQAAIATAARHRTSSVPSRRAAALDPLLGFGRRLVRIPTTG